MPDNFPSYLKPIVGLAMFRLQRGMSLGDVADSIERDSKYRTMPVADIVRAVERAAINVRASANAQLYQSSIYTRPGYRDTVD